MFKSNTVFVVGAGASCEVQLPAGDKLLANIMSDLNLRFHIGEKSAGSRDLHMALRQVAGRSDDRNMLARFEVAAQRVRAAATQSLSIDDILHRHSGDAEMEFCGKLAIVKNILAAEKGSSLRVNWDRREELDLSGVRDTWLTKFSQIATAGLHRKDLDKLFANVTIITFNYDRCIEHFLKHSLIAHYALPDGEAEERVKQLRIIHPYGTVGTLPWLNGKGGTRVRFGDVEGCDLTEIAQGIRTYTEQINDETMLRAMRQSVQESEVLCFLGFAFHDQNMELLRVEKPGRVDRVFASLYGISDSDREQIAASICKTVDKARSHISWHLGGRDCTCAGLFDEYRRSLAA